MDTVNVHSLNLGTWSKCLGNIKIELNCLKSFYSYNKDGRNGMGEAGSSYFVKLLGTTLTVSLKCNEVNCIVNQLLVFWN